MAISFNGSTDEVTKSSSEITGYPCTIAAWFNPSSSAAFQNIAAVYLSSTNTLFALAFSTALKVRAQARTGGTTVNADSTGTTSLGTWTHGAAVQTDATHHLAYINGSAGSNVATSVSPSGFTTTKIASAVGSLSAFGGSIAEVGIWNVALDANEIAALAKGLSPLLVRPSALVFYWPAVRNAALNVKGAAMTVTGTAVADHPRVFGPRWQIFAGRMAGGGPVTGVLSLTLDAVTLSSAAAVAVIGSLSVSLGSLLLSANNASAVRWVKRRLGIGISMHGN